MNSLIKLRGAENWGVWKFQLRVNLLAIEAKGHVDGSSPCPSRPAQDATAQQVSQYNLDLREWSKLDGKAQRLIITSLNEENMLHVMNKETAKEMWDTLHNTFETNTATSIHMLQQQWFKSEKEPNDSITVHIAKIQDLAHRLKALGESVSDTMLITKILMTLPPVFKHFCTAWESTPADLRTLTNLISRLTTEEMRSTSEASNVDGALMAQRSLPKSTATSDRSKKRSSTKGSKQGKRDGKCNYCHVAGHYEYACRTKLKDLSERYEKDTKRSPTASTRSERPRGGALISKSLLSTPSSEISCNDWYLDSGATSHMTGRREWFVDMKESKGSVKVGDGTVLQTTGYGNINILAHDGSKWREKHLKEVLYVPELKFNLFSLGSTLDKGLTQDATKDRCLLKLNGHIQAVGNRQNNLYRMRFVVINPGDNSGSPTALVCSLRTWHERLAHQNYPYVKTLLNSLGIKTTGEKEFCEPCVLGKMTRTSHPPSKSTTKEVGEIIHADVCGFMQTKSLGKARYFLLFKDDFSHYRQVYFLKRKDEVADCLRNFLIRINRETKMKLNILRTDQGLEFTNQQIKAIVDREAIKHQMSVVYTPEQNGKVERDNRTIVEAARTMLYGANLPLTLWAEAINCAVYTLNRTGTSTQHLKTPYELWHGKTPNMSVFRKFGSKVYTHIPDQKRRKWDAKAEVGFLVGYDDEIKGYRVWFPDKHRVSVHCDVVFDEESSTDDRQHGSNSKEDSETAGYISDEEPESAQEAPTSGINEIAEPAEDEQQESDVELQSEPTSSVPAPEQWSSDEWDTGDENDFIPVPEVIVVNTSTEDSSSSPEKLSKRRSVQIRLYTSDSPGSDSSDEAKTGEAEQPSEYKEESSFLAETLEPGNFMEAQKSSEAAKWKRAMEEEMEALRENNTWILVDKPNNANILKNRWVYKMKPDPTGPDKYKARLVVKGYQQRSGLDYTETFSPVVSFNAIRIMLSMIAAQNMYSQQFDVKTAFLYGNLKEDVYMTQPEGFDDKSNKICKLQRSLYGLKQAPRCWNERLVGCLKKFDMICTSVEPCVFQSKEDTDDHLLLAIYVDDGLVASKSKQRIRELLTHLEKELKIKSNPLSLFLGVQIQRLEDGSIFIHQSSYTQRVLNRFNVGQANAVSIPADAHQNLSMFTTPGKEKEPIAAPYREAVGVLLYLSMITRPDIAFSVNAVSQHVSNPQKVHWNAVKRIFKYLKGTVEYGLMFESNNNITKLVSFTDADFCDDVTTRHSITGYIVKFGNSPIMWGSRKQNLVTLSTTEAEFVAANYTLTRTSWAQNLVRELLRNRIKRPDLHVDNQSAIQWIKNGLFQSKGKHVDIKYKYICEKFNQNKFALYYVNTKNQEADIFTKALPRVKFEKLRKMIGVVKLET